MIIRVATADDLPILLDFEQKIIAAERPMDETLKQDEKISYYDIEAYIESDHTRVMVAEDDGQIIAGAYGQIRDRKEFFIEKKLGYIGFMYVRKSHRGQAVSQKLIKAACDWFSQHNIKEVQLHVYAKNPRAIRAYEKAGFEPHLVEMRLNPNTIVKE